MNIKLVMIIDDSDGDQLLTKLTIEEFDSEIKILQAYDGQEALEVLADLPNQPDLVFLDINMPRMNGHEFLEKYGTWENQSPIVIMLTSSDQQQDKENSMKYKCVKKYFPKSLETSDLEELFTSQLF